MSHSPDGDCVTLDADIAGFFDNIPHKLIVDAVAEEVADIVLNKLDKWIRMRVRCLKFKRKLSMDNYRMKQGTFDKKLGLLRMLDFTATSMSKSLS